MGEKKNVVKFFRQCPLCEAPYAEDAVTLLEDRGDAWFMHLVCATCRGSFLSLVSQTPAGISAVATVTDLTPRDADRVRASTPVDENDVCSLYASLRPGATRVSRFEQMLMKAL